MSHSLLHRLLAPTVRRLADALARWAAAGPEGEGGPAAPWQSRLDEAARTWSAHVESAQAQLQQAVDQALQAFALILEELDQVVGDKAAPGTLADTRVAVLGSCDSQLRGLLQHFEGFVRSRDGMLDTVKTLAEASGSLSDMAEDVSRLARQTNLLSINAAIEAARAGTSGRGFAVVAGEVRRLSTESGDTGRRISQQVVRFSETVEHAVEQARRQAESDLRTVKLGEAAVSDVVALVDGAVGQLQHNAAEQRAHGLRVKAQIEQVMQALQFQDRVHQILDQLRHSMGSASVAFGQSLRRGEPPDAARWRSLLGEGYTTHEQRLVAGQAGAASACTETQFF